LQGKVENGDGFVVEGAGWRLGVDLTDGVHQSEG
jgi:hypothetical protein